MQVDSAKLRIKLGQIEVEYEGDPAFIQSGFLDTLKELVDIQQAVAPTPIGGAASSNNVPHAPTGQPLLQQSTATTATIATKLSCKSGTDLALAAAANLHFTQGKAEFTRQEIIDAMKSATAFYNENHRKNLTQSLNTLIKNGRVRDRGGDKFGLSQAEIEKLETVVAGD